MKSHLKLFIINPYIYNIHLFKLIGYQPYPTRGGGVVRNNPQNLSEYELSLQKLSSAAKEIYGAPDYQSRSHGQRDTSESGDLRRSPRAPATASSGKSLGKKRIDSYLMYY